MTEARDSYSYPRQSQEERLALAPPAFIRGLTPEERLLLSVREELYESSWTRMEADLRNRLAGKPYIFKLVNRIEMDLATIAFLRAYEAGHDVDLGAVAEQTNGNG